MIAYLASPYSHRSRWVRWRRYRLACAAAARLMRKGYSVFSPIAHSHPIADFLAKDVRMDHDFWMQQDLPLLDLCDGLFVLALPGWENSRGVEAEIARAREIGLPIVFLQP